MTIWRISGVLQPIDNNGQFGERFLEKLYIISKAYKITYFHLGQKKINKQVPWKTDLWIHSTNENKWLYSIQSLTFIIYGQQKHKPSPSSFTITPESVEGGGEGGGLSRHIAFWYIYSKCWIDSIYIVKQSTTFIYMYFDLFWIESFFIFWFSTPDLYFEHIWIEYFFISHFLLQMFFFCF